jgi:hypothetical protein
MSGKAPKSKAFKPKISKPKPVHVERATYSSKDARAAYAFNAKQAGLDIGRKKKLSPADLQKEESLRPAMHARICDTIVAILKDRFSADIVEAAFCSHAGIQGSLFDKLSADHSTDPNWHPAKWDVNPSVRSYILVAQAIYDDASALSFPKKMSTVLLAKLSNDICAITAFVDGIFPPPPVSGIATEEAFPSLPTAAPSASGGGGESVPAEASPFTPCCTICSGQLSSDFSCQPCMAACLNNAVMTAQYMIEANYNLMCHVLIAASMTPSPFKRYF